MDKVIYYKDELNDDFAQTRDMINAKPVSADYKYIHKGLLWRFVETVLYRFIATPLIYIFCKLVYGLKIKNRKALRKIKGGYYMYANHTNLLMDTFMPTILSFPKKARIVTAPDAVSIPGIKALVQMLGAIPLPSTIAGTRKFMDALDKHLSKKNAIMIYPEAHIWPYYNGIRPFKAASFVYPLKSDVPAVAVTLVYKERKHFKKLPPKIEIVVGDVIQPNKEVSVGESRQMLRDEIYSCMCKTVKDENSFEYIKYIKVEDDKKEA